MVVIHIKRTDTDQFLFETKCDESVDALIRKLVDVWNTRLRVKRLADAAIDLANHGIARLPKDRGIDEVKEMSGEALEKGAHYNPDPTGNRDGNAPPPSLQETIKKVCEEAKEVVSKTLVDRKIAITKAMLQEKIDNIRGAVTMAYPMGLPEYDTVRQGIEDTEELAGAPLKEMHDPETASLWWAGKEFFRDQKVSDRVGRNEKTKIVGRIQPKGAGAPVREPAVSEDERKAMMAHYFKKTEEAKKLAAADDDEYLGTSWANPKALKSSLMGGGSISWRPGGR